MSSSGTTSSSGRAARGSRELRAARRHERGLGWVLVAPLMVLLALIVVYPLIQIGWTSLRSSTFIDPVERFVGLENYRRLFDSRNFWKVARQSGLWTVLVVGGQFVVGLAVALLLNQTFRGRSALRALVLVPWVMPGVLAGILWRFMYDPYLGLINYVAGNLGLWNDNPAWLADESTALFAVIVAAIWKGAPFSVLLYLAALQGRSIELMEAARVDGAGAWSSFRHVTLPAIAPVIRSTLILTVIWTFNHFDLIYVMTRGGPGTATEIAPTYLYRLAFTDANFGQATAYGVLTIGVLTAFSVLYLRQLDATERQP